MARAGTVALLGVLVVVVLAVVVLLVVPLLVGALPVEVLGGPAAGLVVPGAVVAVPVCGVAPAGEPGEAVVVVPASGNVPVEGAVVEDVLDNGTVVVVMGAEAVPDPGA